MHWSENIRITKSVALIKPILNSFTVLNKSTIFRVVGRHVWVAASLFLLSQLAPFSSFALSPTAFSTSPKDSIGVEKKGNKILILHKIEPGQTLSAVARRYGSTLSAIRAENPDGGDALQPGQIVKVPYTAPPTKTTAGKTKAQFHTVEAGQSLMAISRLYKVSVANIKKWNHLTSDNISVGDELAISAEAAASRPPTIHAQAAQSPNQAESTTSDSVQQPVAKEPIAKEQPKKEPKKSEPKPPVTKVETPASTSAPVKKTHTVAPGQTLNAVARLYKISVDNIKKWNNLTSNNLVVGQEILVEADASNASYNVTDQSAMEEPRKSKESEVDKVAGQPQAEVQEPVTKAERKEEKKEDKKDKEEAKESKASEANPSYTISNASGYQRIMETGLAELIDDTQDTEKYLALHRTAPVGTIIQVKNLMNDLSVFVRVIGKLPNTGANDKLVIKISRKAHERLAAIDRKFRVEVSYMP